MKKLNIIRGLMVVLLILPIFIFLSSGIASAQILGEIIDLGTFGGYSSYAFDINELGQVVGYAEITSGYPHAFLWTQESGMQDLGTLGGNWSGAFDINDHGQVAGYSQTAAGGYSSHAFLWTQEGGMQDLGHFGGDSSYPYSINNNGQIVGSSTTASGYSHAFLWTQEGGMQDLGTLGGNQSIAHDINELGQVVGFAYTADEKYHAFLWTQEGGMQDLGTLGGSQSTAYDINELGQVVGYAHTAVEEPHAFLWTQESGMQDLGHFGGNSSYSFSINNSGQVVGHATTVSWYNHAFLWTQESGMQDLGTLGGLNSSSSHINDNGQVVGYAEPASGMYHAFLWTQEGGMQDLGTLGADGSISNHINELGQVVGYLTYIEPEGYRAFLWNPASYTPTGSNVTVEPSVGINITFDQVTTPGNTTISSCPEPPSPPSGYTVLGTCKDIATTATYVGQITVCFTYDDTGLSDESIVKVFHWEGSWVDVTCSLDTIANRVCGCVSQLSPFIIAIPSIRPEGLQPPLAVLVPEGDEVPMPDKAFKQGRTLPLKLQLFSGETALTDQDVLPPIIASLVRSGEPLDLETIDLDAGEANDSGLLFRFSDGNWVYNLSTKSLSTGTYVITLQMPDGRRWATGFVLK